MENITQTPAAYEDEILSFLRSDISKEELAGRLSDYHKNDIADAITHLSPEERARVYTHLGAQALADIFIYLDDAADYLKEIDIDKAAKIISFMDADDAVDVIEDMDKDEQQRLVALLDDDSGRDVRRILSYGEDEIGSLMTNDYILIDKDLSLRAAMQELIRQAGEHDNVSTIYVKDEKGHYAGAIDLKDLIIARAPKPLEELIATSYPFVKDHEKISDCIERIRDYEEDSIPVLSEDKTILGAITAHDIVEAVDDELGDDYAKFAGLTAESDLKETTVESMRKRLPWLIVLLFLGMGVSSVVGTFEAIVAALPIVMCFQSMVLDMSGNAGTQSLAVTIRVLSDEELTLTQKLRLVGKEVRVGFCNGILLGMIALVFIGLYVVLFRHYPVGQAFLVSACVGMALLLSTVLSSLTGTLIPLFFHRIHVDPAVASGPLITTLNDLAAVITYYGLAWLFLIQWLQ